MTRAPSPAGLDELRNPTSADAQVAALKQLKNFIVGHDQRKELAVRRGIVAHLARVLQANVKASGKRRQRQSNGGAAAAQNAEQAQEDDMRLQATFIVESLAHGGAPFVTPILAGGLLQPLLGALSPAEAPPKLLTATLRTLIALSSATSTDPFPNSTSARIARELYYKPEGDSLLEIIAQRSNSWITLEQVGLAASLISKTCREESHKSFLVKSGVLDSLAARFASYAVSEGYVRPGSDASYIASLPPAPRQKEFLAVVEAISTIISPSNYRIAVFLSSPAIVAVFPGLRLLGPDEKQAMLTSPRRPHAVHAAEMLLPQLQPAQGKESNFSRAFPALGSLSAPSEMSRISSFADIQSQANAQYITGEEYESPIYAWLIRKTREAHGKEQLTFMRLLEILMADAENHISERPSEHSREGQYRLLSILIVPLLAKMVDEASSGDGNGSSNGKPDLQGSDLLPDALRQLAKFLEHSPILQKSANDANVIKKVCQILKKTFEAVPQPSRQKRWSPTPLSAEAVDESLEGEERSDMLGSAGVPMEMLNVLKCREASLLALAAVAHKEDSHRKIIIEAGAVACIADSLVAYEQKDEDVFARGNVSNGTKDGNPVVVLRAACRAARSMSRSVSVLRTSMMDYGIGKPIYKLLKHPNLEVCKAATDVLCNLLLQFSPMREDLIEAGALKTLCEHASSADTELRLTSMWALKHLVLQADNEIKMTALEELGTGWLIQTVSGPATPLGMSTPNAAHEQVDILNAVEEPSMDIDNGSGISGDEDDVMADSIGLLRPRSTQETAAARMKARLRTIREAETNPAIKAQQDELRIQEQALDFIRNLIMAEPGTDPGVMIDHVLQAFGRDRFFEILTAKLRPRNPGPTAASRDAALLRASASSSPDPTSTSSAGAGATTATNTTSSNAYTYLAPPEILLGTAFIAVHVANGPPAHRQLILSQTPLMQHLVPLFGHPDRRIRVACVWLINNLTWIEDDSDRAGARLRAQELRKLGIEERVRACLGDAELDVRERAKTAVEQLAKLLDGLPPPPAAAAAMGLGQQSASGGAGVGQGQGAEQHAAGGGAGTPGAFPGAAGGGVAGLGASSGSQRPWDR
ncbi:uncharacterized protein K452DRAFT_294623 [Aplosporella prunicola CBS 121167]|uniref:Uncharacterized protein n=1 Tax=Aplosporella prunicola CBS 121167 TaxID=1176127 RepID=A0A6A6BPJ3_9PEZI|nr:uncharacterized protein K452DRAFT_294623 [Aplosporella prunicola CBS 121167]KAF2146012.1 hypothetical protein K452DRAFT_294623 [Aplosporella prunicola CBS 121167]